MPKLIDDNQIYRDVMQAVIAQGYNGATTKQMAARAGISEVTLFRKYGSKAQLVRQAMTALAEQSDFASAAEYTGDVVVDLLRIVTIYQNSAEQEGRLMYTMLVEAQRHPELADVLDRPMGMIQNIGQLIARYQAEGVLKREHPLQALVRLIGPLITTNMLRSALGDAPIPPLKLTEHVARFLDGHRVESSG